MKTCTRCKNHLPLTAFGKNSKSKDKLHYWCKGCCNRKLKNCKRCRKHLDLSEFGPLPSSPSGLSPYCKSCHVSNDDHYARYKKSARDRKIAWELTEEQFYRLWQKPCMYCGDDIATIGIDRQNNREGYKLGNVIPCCTKCNYHKSVYSLEAWLQHSLKVLLYQGVVIKTPDHVAQLSELGTQALLAAPGVLEEAIRATKEGAGASSSHLRMLLYTLQHQLSVACHQGILRQEDTNMITTLGLESQRQAFDSLAALIPNLKDISVRKALYEVQSLLSIAVQETREEEKLRG